MARVSNARRTSRRLSRGAQLRCTSSDEERPNDTNANNAPSNVVENDNVVEEDIVVPPPTTQSLPTTVQGTSSVTKISAIRGWTKEDMLAAIDDIEFNGYSIRAAAKKHGVATSSVHYWINGLTHTKRRGPVTVMSEEEEAEVVQWCKEMAEMGHGLELIQLKSTVAQICQGRPNPFKDGFPGKSWWSGFKKRHPDLVLRTAEGLDRDRALNLRPAILTKFYATLSSAYENHGYAPDHIWNCDETGLQAGRNCGMRVIAKRGSRNVPKILPRSREWITILCCVNAIGASIPGFYLFKGKTQLKNYIQNCEPGACMAAHPHAWMTKELFLNWLTHFAASIPGGVSPVNRHLLVLDGHGSHIAVQTIEEANNLGIDLLTLPTHTTHRLQPLDVSVFGPFKNYFRGERALWMAQNPGVEVKRFELAELASKAFKRALTPSNIKAGFRRTGIWPLNSEALMHDTSCSLGFDLNGQEEGDVQAHVAGQEDVEVEEDVVAADHMISLSQGEPYCGDEEEQVSETQYNNEPIDSNMEVHTPTETAANSASNLLNVSMQETVATSASVHVNENVDHAPGSSNGELTLPSQVTPQSWLVEAMMNLDKNIVSRTNEESMNMPSQPRELEEEIVHYFVDNGNLVEDSVHNEVPAEEDNMVQIEQENIDPNIERQESSKEQQVSKKSQLLGRFLKLPVERVSAKRRQFTADNLRLCRSSQLLTSEDYIKLLVESEHRKLELQDLKQKKRDLAKEKKAARIAAAEIRAQERLDREKERQEKAHQKQMARHEKELRKAQQLLQKEQGVAKSSAIDANIVEGSRMMPNTLEHLADNTPCFQDLLNIQVPRYQQVCMPTLFPPTSAGVRHMYDYWGAQPNAGFSSTSVHCGYSIPPWLQEANWISYGGNQPQPNQPLLGMPTNLAQAGNSTILGSEDLGRHQA